MLNTAPPQPPMPLRHRLKIPTCPEPQPEVLTLSWRDYGLSRSYRITVDCLATVPLSSAFVLGCRAALMPGGRTRSVHGIITGLDDLESGPAGHHCQRVHLESPLGPLARSRHQRVFTRLTVPQVLERVLIGHGWRPGDWRMVCGEGYPVRPFIAQVDEDDLAFLSRLMAFEGLHYRFEQGAEKAVLVISDDSRRAAEGEMRTLRYEPLKGEVRGFHTIHRLMPRTRLLPTSITLRDHDPDQPGTPAPVHVRSNGDLPGAGKEEHWGTGFHQLREGERLAQLRLQALECDRLQVRILTDCTDLEPGQRLSVAGYPGQDFNRVYVIVRVDLDATQAHALPMGGTGGHTPDLRVKVDLLPLEQPFRPRYRPHRVHGRLAARVDGNPGEGPLLDDQGRYWLRFDFDGGAHAVAEASAPVRLLTPYAAPGGGGFHFPLHPGTEVLVGFENSDPHRPVILGALPNRDQPSPVNADNPGQNLLRTPAGNELCLDDRTGNEQLRLATRDGDLHLTLDATQDAHRLILESRHGEMHWLSGRAMHLKIGADQQVEIGGDQKVEVQGDALLITESGEIRHQAADNLLLEAGENLQLLARQGDFLQRSEGAMTLNSANDLELVSEQGHLRCRVLQGDAGFHVMGEMLWKTAAGGIQIGDGMAGIRITAGGDVVIQGREVRIEAETIRMDADRISQNGA
ncbi:type VI secretion system Vgr family protein [Ectothiorhodospira lacustris]|uniref:type VI secretion system Vgr family protein n=1 Tax=Ectothiorhodospira lacustris TaxID=2899127 RepID=UPI001EE8432B|nr:type VI secretion system Vgr family protein [Ectothiorhodospira lacustris]MCG5509246.1 type VI secretion system Vgr family protein [Ectothiorhodospira lacustris]MCG5521036.1 type VI secretion system Vgr family protein [Ectothiorhodospira lacustris]